MKNRQKFFNEAAATWDNNFQTKELESFLEKTVAICNIVPGSRILDAGAGTGILIPFLLKAVGARGHVTAIDYAEKMIDKCSSKYGHFRNVSIELQQIEKMDFAPEYFDAVVCFGSFPHLDNKVEAVNRFERVLRPGGRLIIAHALSSAQIKAHHSKTAAIAKDILPEETKMRRLLEDAGFTKVSIVDKPGCYLCISEKLSRKPLP
jgi:ubiquinone/menaquinone biosynthesis C-methylase UbiE